MNGDDFDFGDDDADRDISWREIADTSLYMVDVVARELEEIGYRVGLARMAEGDSLGEAIWHAAPQHCRIGGPVWHDIERGVRRAYGVEDEL